jgi:vacuolar-type H+-ATPase subunit H
MSEIDVIGHLMDVESQASALIFEAQTVAEKNISEARSKAESLYKERYENLIKEFESNYTESTNKVLQENRKAFEEYQQQIQSLSQDVKSFNELLDSLLFEGKK